MSNYLTKPYEISLWKDGPSGEEKICTIGTDTMEGQNRAFEPIFSRNVNGVKKLSFKIYKKYVDTQTGEEVDNPYVPYLISERKVKLHLLEESSDNEWHDFIIKNVSENSATHLCTYQLEDALVQELSKNGFGVTLDAKLMNNIGTANELASYVLCETDWDVSENSEAFVQTIDEALVYLTFPQNPATGLKVYKITGQKEGNRKIGVTANELDSLDDLKGKTILAFYSSCTGRPHRFQFLYSANGYNTEEALKNYISNETDYQYYIDFDNPEDDYSNKIQDFYLPAGFNTTTVDNSVLCTDYRGRRYGFSQQAKYIPVLDRYVQLYNKVDDNGKYIKDENGDKVVYYGYEHVEYKSPALTQNMISNSTFESTSGWTGTKSGTSGDKAKVEAVYGYFDDKKTFVSAIKDLQEGEFDPKTIENPNGKDYKAYLKLNFNGANSTAINSGPFDNRTLIGSMVTGDEWALTYQYRIGNTTYTQASGEDQPLTFSLGEYVYSSNQDGYIPTTKTGDDERVSFTSSFKTEQNNDETQTVYQIFTVKEEKTQNGKSLAYSKESFKKNMQVRLQISASGGCECYLEKIELFKVAYCNDKIIPLNEQANSLEDRTVEKTYYYFTNKALENITSADQLKEEFSTKTLSYTTYKPVYNEGAQKVRTVTAKESNYFNILQSIAETFEAWLTFDVTRENGGITSKKIAFKNYVGGNNYACFRYGVNLKDIQRTFESKNIVTKLIVKNNSNEHADGGFCTIQRANANPTGENYIYDFQYFFNEGLMDDREYLDTLYVIDGAEGPDYLLWYDGDTPGPVIYKAEPTLQGYFPRIKALNNKIQAENELLANIAQDLTKYKADLAVADAGFKAATSGIEEVREDFLLLTGAPIDALMNGDITAITIGNKAEDAEQAKENNGYYYSDRDWLDDSNPVVIVSNVQDSKITITVIAKETSKSSRTIDIKIYPKITLDYNESFSEITQQYIVRCVIPENATTCTIDQNIVVGDFTNNSGAQKKIEEYAIYTVKENNYSQDKIDAQEKVDALEAQYNTKQDYIENSLKYWKRQLNRLFFEKYSRFIQEGTWISEEYVDDGLYYADAQSVMYNSCYPQVAYTINVISVEGLPGYEDFKYKLGEKTWVVDPDFFGDEDREPVIITEIVENLDNRSKNQIKVQNFKNQFQDLFQKITATVQQAQYNTGSYEKAVALAEANQERKQQFLTDALDSASARLTTAGQQSVIWGNDGITVKSINSPNDAIRMVGGAILLSKQDENGEQKWVTGVTSDGVSASLITAGVLNAGEISIMNYDEPVFRWDTFGISAYDATWYNGGTDVGTVISGVNTKKFVRFDKHGIYGINDAGVDGANWHPQDSNEIDEKSTFALTWEGLKVTGNKDNDGNQIIAKIGKNNNGILDIINTKIDSSKTSDNSQSIFRIGDDGSVLIRGSLEIEGDSGIYKDVTEYVDDEIDSTKSSLEGQISSTKSSLEGQISSIKTETKTYVDGVGKELQDQIDGAITTYFEKGEPTSENENNPANNWTTAEEKDKHLGDLYYDTDTQYCYRWGKNENGQYVWEQIADEGITEALKAAKDAQDTADGKRTTYGYSPNTEKPSNYQDGDLWIIPRDNETSFDVGSKKGTYAGEILQCILGYSGDYRPTDWVVATKYTDNTELDTFKQKYYLTLTDINNQLDKKAETHYGKDDPAVYSGDGVWGAERVGDLWHCAEEIKDSNGTVIRAKNSEWIWQGTTTDGVTTYQWHEMVVSDVVFDTIDGKATIYVSLPSAETELRNGDLLIPVSDISSTDYKQGKVYRWYKGEAETEGEWVQVDYTDDTLTKELQEELEGFQNSYESFAQNIQNQVDSKAQTWYTNDDPSATWNDSEKAKHVGDLWHYTGETGEVNGINRGKNSEWIYQQNGNSYAWKAMEVPQAVFDTIDGIASIYTTIPTNPNNGDLLIPVNNISSGGKTYVSSKVYRYNDKTKEWEPIDYTDETTVTTKIGEIKIGGRNLLPNTSQDFIVDNTFTDANGNYSKYFYKTIDIIGGPLSDGNYTISANVKDILNEADKPLPWGVSIAAYDNGISNHLGGREVAIENGKISGSFEVSKGATKLLIYAGVAGETEGNKLTFSRMKFEKGTIATDWTAAPEDLDNAIDSIQTQLDKKAEIFYQPNDPSLDENEEIKTEWKNDNYLSNIWRCTEQIIKEDVVIRKKNSEWVWQKNGEDYAWHEMEIPDNVFDAYDGKATIFTSQPSNYNIKDLWILAEDTIINGKTYKEGYILTATSSSIDYNQNHWTDNIKYTDDTRAEEALIEAQNKIPADISYDYTKWKADENGLRFWASDVKINAQEGDSFLNTPSMLFKVGRELKEDGSYETGLWMRGKVWAKEGEIGGWKILPDSFSSEDTNQGKITLFSNTNQTYRGSSIKIAAGTLDEQPERKMYQNYVRELDSPKSTETLLKTVDLRQQSEETASIFAKTLSQYSQEKTYSFNYTTTEIKKEIVEYTITSQMIIDQLLKKLVSSGRQPFTEYNTGGYNRGRFDLAPNMIALGNYYLIKLEKSGYDDEYFIGQANNLLAGSGTGYWLKTLTSNDAISTSLSGSFSVKYLYANYNGWYLEGKNSGYVKYDYFTVYSIGNSLDSIKTFTCDLNPNLKNDENFSREITFNYPNSLTKQITVNNFTNTYKPTFQLNARLVSISGAAQSESVFGTVSTNVSNFSQTLTYGSCLEASNPNTYQLNFKMSTTNQNIAATFVFNYAYTVLQKMNRSYDLKIRGECTVGDTTLESYKVTFSQTTPTTISNTDNWPLKTKIEGGKLKIYEPANIVETGYKVGFLFETSVSLVNNAEYPFILTADGTLFASKVDIQGDITATVFRQQVDGKLKKHDGVQYIPLLNFSYLSAEYVVYTAFTFSKTDITGDGVGKDFATLGNLLIVPLDTWNSWSDFE